MQPQTTPTKSQLMTAYNKVRHLPNVDKGRLNRAFGIAQSKRIEWVGDEHGTLNIASSDGTETFHVNGNCQCGDYKNRTHVCKHRLARRLIQVAKEN